MASSVGNDHFRLVLLGKTGGGKSSSGNTILGSKKFKTGKRFKGVTTECAWEEADLRSGDTVEVVDTPGLCDPETSDEDTAIIIARTMVGMDPGPHVIVYVLMLGRFTKEEYTAFKKLETLFDKRLYQYLIVIITGGDDIDEGDTIEGLIEEAPNALRQLMKDCKNRYVVFDNKSGDSAQVDTLLRMMKELVSKNSSQPHYNCEKFRALGEELDKEVTRRMVEVEKEQMRQEKVFQDQIAQYEKELAQMEKEIEEALAMKEMSEEEAKQIQEEHRKRTEEMEKELQDMKAQHWEQRQEDHVRKTIKRESMTSTGGIWFSTMVNVASACIYVTAGVALAVAAAPTVAVAAPLVLGGVAAAGAVAGAVVAWKIMKDANGEPVKTTDGADTAKQVDADRKDK